MNIKITYSTNNPFVNNVNINVTYNQLNNIIRSINFLHPISNISFEEDFLLPDGSSPIEYTIQFRAGSQIVHTCHGTIAT